MSLPVPRAALHTRHGVFVGAVVCGLMQVGHPVAAQTGEAPVVVDSVVIEPSRDGLPDDEGALSPAQELALEAEEAVRPVATDVRAAPVARPAAPRTRFVLREVSLPRSQYLEPEVVDAVVDQLIGRRMDLRNLEVLTVPLNALYRDRGLMLANVVIREINMESGLIELAFYEPKVGQVRASDGALARGDVYAWRLALDKGDLADTRRIEARQTRLEVLTGVTTEVAVQQGESADELDFVITPVEPPALRFSAVIDNHGTPSFGREQLTLSASHASLFGRLDAFSASVTISEGLRSGALGYSFPITPEGVSVFFAGSLEKSRSIFGPPQSVETWSAEVGLSYPVIVERERQLSLRGSVQRFSEERRSVGVLTTDQSGTVFLLGGSYSQFLGAGGLAYDQTIRHIRWSDGTFGGGRTTLLGGEGSFSARIRDGWQVFGRLGWQHALGQNSPTQFRTTLSSPTRVRGYPSGNSSGDSFVFGSLQLQSAVPIALNDDAAWRVTAQPFVFVDAGRAFDRVAGVTTAQDPLVSAGLGSVFQIGTSTVAEVSLAKPLRNANLFNAGGEWRADFRLGVRF